MTEQVQFCATCGHADANHHLDGRCKSEACLCNGYRQKCERCESPVEDAENRMCDFCADLMQEAARRSAY